MCARQDSPNRWAGRCRAGSAAFSAELERPARGLGVGRRGQEGLRGGSGSEDGQDVRVAGRGRALPDPWDFRSQGVAARCRGPRSLAAGGECVGGHGQEDPEQTGTRPGRAWEASPATVLSEVWPQGLLLFESDPYLTPHRKVLFSYPLCGQGQPRRLAALQLNNKVR